MTAEEPRTSAYYLVIDLEATCTQDDALPREEMETIEIGAVMVDGQSLAPIDEFQTFVRPVRHPVLTPFCRQLTTITQEQVDGAPLFPEALAALTRFVTGRNALFSSWGAYDKGQFEQHARWHQVELPFGPDHLNIKHQFSHALRERRPYGVKAALKRVGLELVGTHHRGIDDARNIARLLPWALGRQGEVLHRSEK